ncbi:NAD-dependent epimerase/dehydratase family protein [Reichenbachiella sp. MALMAid0571]|uniref:NAD-dependent epimerase/dehydratase family protein n=1 Tax=Reichenbachiella sp. MALMAid0571 TaxID=3143939 RepID=UPI0032DE561A
MKITSLVTGGAGFIGSYVANNLIALGHRVIVLDDLSGGVKKNVRPSARFYAGSITDESLVNKLFEKYKFTYVYHLAAYAAEGLSHFIRKFNYEHNLMGSINLINASVNHEVKCFVFTSSIAVYGTGTLPMKESNPPCPEDPYGIAKYAIEMDLLNAQKMFGLNYVIFRPHNVYGINQNIADKYRNVIGIFMNQILAKQSLTIFGDGQQSRSFTYIDDVAPYIANSVNVPEAINQTFNIGNDSVHTVRELADAVNLAMETKLDIRKLEQRKEVLHAYADHSKFKEIFKPKQFTDLHEGLFKMAQWVRANGHQPSQQFENIEITKNLPNNWNHS